jgi:glutamate dehydrogenase (NAD(P)+)
LLPRHWRTFERRLLAVREDPSRDQPVDVARSERPRAPEVFGVADDLGPAKVIHVHEPTIGLRGILVIDNVACGPSIGGMRMAPDVTLEECVRLARAMTFKNAAAGLAHGGGKSVLCADPNIDPERKERLIRAFAHALRNETDYIFGPDMGTNETAMAWVNDEIGRAVGLPAELGGIPLDEIGATGWGLRHATEVAATFCDLELRGARMAIQGFGAVGKHAAGFLSEVGVVLVAASDSNGTLADPGGIDIAALVALKDRGRAVTDHPKGARLAADAIIDVECDIWIPAARPDVITETNAHRLRARLMPQGANIPCSKRAEKILHERGILVVPDFIANAGGVICAAMEYAGATRSAAFAAIAEKIRVNTQSVLACAKAAHSLPRQAAEDLARQRLSRAMRTRRFAIL